MLGFSSYSYFSKTYSSSSFNVFISIELLEERINFIHIEPDLLVVVSNFDHKWLSTHLVTSIPGFRFSSTRFPPLGNRQDVTPIYQLIWPNKCWVWGSRERGHWGRNWQVQMTSRIIKVRVPRSLMKELAARHFKNMTRKYAYQRPLIWYVVLELAGCGCCWAAWSNFDANFWLVAPQAPQVLYRKGIS